MKKIRFNRSILLHYGMLIMGAMILAFGMFNVHSRSQVTEGGVLGLTLLLHHWFGITPGISGLILDGICYFIGYKMLGKVFLKNAIIASLCFSAFYNLFETIGPLLPDFNSQPFIAALVGGLFVGIGVGLVVRAGGASGGDDALALAIAKITHWKISRAYLFTDLVVLMLALTYIPFTRIFYSLITVTVSSFLIERIHSLPVRTAAL